jgi:acetolactate decarboxylase
MVEFRGDQALAVRDGTDFPGFQRLIDAVSPNTNLLCAVRFEGRFRHMRVRSVPGQSKPYPPLVEVTRHQPMFEHNDVEGTLVGFRLPSYVKGINVPGYHVHFISKDRQVGGHVLAFLVAGGTVILDTCHRFVMILPRDGSGFNRVDFNQDRSKELEKAEK